MHKLLVITKTNDGPGEEMPVKYNSATMKKAEFNTILLTKTKKTLTTKYIAFFYASTAFEQ